MTPGGHALGHPCFQAPSAVTGSNRQPCFRLSCTTVDSLNRLIVKSVDGWNCGMGSHYYRPQIEMTRLVLPASLRESELARFESLTATMNCVQAERQLYQRGTALENVYLIEKGGFKTVARIHGREQIIEFYFPTDLLGLDGASEAFHVVDAIAMENSVVRVVRFSSLKAFSRDFPALQSQVDQIANAEGARISQAAAPLGSRMAKERIASFLLDTSSKFEAAGCSPTDLSLSVSRQELANYLGTRIETVGWVLSMFWDEGILEIQGKHILILDRARLEKASRSGPATT